MYLLDTDVLSNLMRRAPSSTLIARLAEVPPEQQFTSSITLGELIYGAYRLAERRADLLQLVEERILPNLQLLPFGTVAAWHYGEIRANLEQYGTPIGDADIRIAAIAIADGLTVVTGNVRHFQRISDLRVENWLS